MAYPNRGQTRAKLDAYTNVRVVDEFDISGGTDVFNLNIGQGMKLTTLTAVSANNDGIVTVSVAPYLDYAQTEVGGAASVVPPTGVIAPGITLNAGVGDGYYSVLSYDDAGAPVGLVSMYGFKVTITVSTSTTGTLTLEAGSVGY